VLGGKVNKSESLALKKKGPRALKRKECNGFGKSKNAYRRRKKGANPREEEAKGAYCTKKRRRLRPEEL